MQIYYPQCFAVSPSGHFHFKYFNHFPTQVCIYIDHTDPHIDQTISPAQPLLPKQIVSELDKFIIGQTEAKKAVAVALSNFFSIYYQPGQAHKNVYKRESLETTTIIR